MHTHHLKRSKVTVDDAVISEIFIPLMVDYNDKNPTSTLFTNSTTNDFQFKPPHLFAIEIDLISVIDGKKLHMHWYDQTDRSRCHPKDKNLKLKPLIIPW